MLDFCTSQEIFHPSRKNPNGCPIAATFYVSHEWTDYGLVQSLYSGGSSWIPRRHPVSLIEKHVTRSGKKYSDILIEKYVSWCLTRNHGAIPQTVTRSPRIQSHTASANRFVIGNEFKSRVWKHLLSVQQKEVDEGDGRSKGNTFRCGTYSYFQRYIEPRGVEERW